MSDPNPNTPPPPPAPEPAKPGHFDAIVSRDDVMPVEHERIDRREEGGPPREPRP